MLEKQTVAHAGIRRKTFSVSRYRNLIASHRSAPARKKIAGFRRHFGFFTSSTFIKRINHNVILHRMSQFSNPKKTQIRAQAKPKTVFEKSKRARWCPFKFLYIKI